MNSLKYVALISCIPLLMCCKGDSGPLEPTADISSKFKDPVLRKYVANVIEYARYDGKLSDNQVSVRNVATIVALNIACNYPGAEKVKSLAGIEYLTGVEIVDLRNQSDLVGTYDLRRMTDLYYIRIEGSPKVKLIVTPEQKRLVMGELDADGIYVVFDGNPKQIIVR